MVFLDVVAVGLALGLATGGRLDGLARLRLRRTWLLFAALAGQSVALVALGPWLWVVSYALLAAGVLSNLRVTGVPLMAAGLLANVAAVVANGGRMPALPSTGVAYTVWGNSVVLAEPRLAWLVDRWAVPAWIPLGNVFSVGDVILAAGTIVVIVAAMSARGTALEAEHVGP